MIKRFGILTVVLLLASSAFAQFTKDAGTVGLWNFDEGSGETVADGSGKGNNGSIVGDGEWVDGNFGKAYSFDGIGSAVIVPDNASLELTKDFTIEAWIKPSRTGYMNPLPITGIICSKHQAHGGRDYGWFFRFGYFQSTCLTFAATSFTRYAGSDNFDAGNWMYVAMSYSASNGKISFYKDGEKLGTQVWVDLGTKGPGDQMVVGIRENDRPFIIGAQGDRTGKNVPSTVFDGLMDGLRVSNRVRSAAEIKSHWDANKSNLPPASNVEPVVRDVYYLAPDGVDGPDRGTIDKPFGSFRYAVQIPAGSTLLIRGGIYDNSREGVNVSQVATEDNWTEIKNYPGELPILDNKQKSGNGIRLSNARYMLIEGLVFKNCRYTGIFVGGGAENIIVRYCIGDDNWRSAMGAWHTNKVRFEYCISAHTGWHPRAGMSGFNFWEMQGHEHVALGCVAFNNTDVCGKVCDDGIPPTDGSGFIGDLGYGQGSYKAINCIAFDNEASGIHATKTQNCEFINCTSVRNGSKPGKYTQNEAQYACWGPPPKLFNCIGIAAGASGPTRVKPNGGTMPNQNCILENGINGVKFVGDDESNWNFDLQQGSPAIDKGNAGVAPEADCGFDFGCLTYVSNGHVFPDGARHFSWMKHDLNYDYIRQKGGVKGIFNPRERDSKPDIGAYEFGTEPIVGLATPTRIVQKRAIDKGAKVYDILGRGIEAGKLQKAGHTSGLLLVETKDGYRFRSIDKSIR